MPRTLTAAVTGGEFCGLVDSCTEVGTQIDFPQLHRLAGRQWGVVTRGQLIRLGFSANGIAGCVRTGRLIRLHRGVYAVGHDRLRLQGRWMAAVMACGPGAALSHRDAAVMWDLRQSSTAVIDVTVPSQNGRRRPGFASTDLGGFGQRT